jgi:glycine cleavage system regulatory protein
VATSLVLTVIGADRPGLVELVADTARAHQANWEESRMARLGKRFAGIVLLTVDDARVDALAAGLRGLEARGLTIVVEHDRAAEPGKGRKLRLDLVGPDRPGIVRELSTVLAASEINVEDLHTQVVSAPMSGEPMFKLVAQLRAPETLSLGALQTSLRELAQDLVCDVSVEEDA